FHNDNPIVLELGCGKGEYAVGLGKRFPDKNYIGIDIKGARMWTGAKMVERQHITNVAFLRTSIELIDRMFAPGEVSEIWITFPDPQMKKVNKRLTSTRFLENYRKVLEDNGVIHLKTDSPFLYTYTRELIKVNSLPVEVDTDDLYASGMADDILEIKTHYEMQWLQRGLTIKYLKFHLPHAGELQEPDIEIEPDTYRSYNRGNIQMPQLMNSSETNE
ncbi:MAG: tRNA (guanosine(46)-N7)-methyltransferase TrmB, partial [Muribaculaceae bacterium]|nr:tRNA (guanosine(46)-N7)-methyltransferase TrmB [Muribaculaceae bacterium]